MNEDRRLIAEWCVSNVQEGDAFLDIGADIGEMSEAVLLAGKAKKIITVDPEGDYLREKFGNKVVILETLVGDREGMATMFRNPENTALNSLYRRRDLKNVVEVIKPITTVDAIVNRFQIDSPMVVKVDAEFAEPLIWMGMRKSLHLVRAMVMEFQLEAMERFNVNGEALLLKIRQAGFKYQYLDRNNIEITKQ